MQFGTPGYIHRRWKGGRSVTFLDKKKGRNENTEHSNEREKKERKLRCSGHWIHRSQREIANVPKSEAATPTLHVTKLRATLTGTNAIPIHATTRCHLPNNH